MKLPTLSQVKQAHHLAISRYGPNDFGIFRPDQLNAFESQLDLFAYYHHNDLLLIAAWIISQINVIHYFNDGNKRTSYLVALTFLELHGCTPQGEHYLDTLYNLTINVADAKITEYEVIKSTLSLVYECL